MCGGTLRGKRVCYRQVPLSTAKTEKNNPKHRSVSQIMSTSDKFYPTVVTSDVQIRNQILLSNQQDAQLSQRDRAAGCVIVFAKSRTLELGDNDLRTL